MSTEQKAISYSYAPQQREAKRRITEELRKVYPSAKDLKEKLSQIQGDNKVITQETCYKLAQELFQDWYLGDIREFYLDCGYTSIYDHSYKRITIDHYKRVANVILSCIQNNY